MTDVFNQTPRASRLHIGIFGKRNAGKSSLINAITGHNTALVSDIAGSTADPVYKAMEIHDLGPAVFIDTAGLDDLGELGVLRTEKTLDALSRSDIALFVFTGEPDAAELSWLDKIKESKARLVAVLNKTDQLTDTAALTEKIKNRTGQRPVPVSALYKTGLDELYAAISQSIPADFDRRALTAGLIEKGDSVLLVMPQDQGAPQGRLILPQAQTIRELLDKDCLVFCCTAAGIDKMLAAIPVPRLIITDSQAFAAVYAKKPPQSALTSFSILMAAAKGDIKQFLQGARAIDRLTEASRVLIAEACAHAPVTEDIGREKIPALLRKRFGAGIRVDFVSGGDFPADLSAYDMVIHCGACMFNRRYMIGRLAKAAKDNVPMCNYGIFLAHTAGILDKIVL